MKPLTTRQAEVLEFIRQEIEVHGLPPTIAQIGRALGVSSPNGIRDHLRALARKGAIELLPAIPRGIRLTQNERHHGLPIVGRVAAGTPILAQAHIEAYCRLDPRLFQPRADYLLRVQGMSMRDAGILDGDLLVVHRSAEARRGQIVVARLDDEVTVKRFGMKGDIVRLEAANPEFSAIRIDPRRTELCIEGVGVGIIRNRSL